MHVLQLDPKVLVDKGNKNASIATKPWNFN